MELAAAPPHPHHQHNPASFTVRGSTTPPPPPVAAPAPKRHVDPASPAPRAHSVDALLPNNRLIKDARGRMRGNGRKQQHQQHNQRTQSPNAEDQRELLRLAAGLLSQTYGGLFASDEGEGEGSDKLAKPGPSPNASSDVGEGGASSGENLSEQTSECGARFDCVLDEADESLSDPACRGEVSTRASAAVQALAAALTQLRTATASPSAEGAVAALPDDGGRGPTLGLSTPPLRQGGATTLGALGADEPGTACDGRRRGRESARCPMMDFRLFLGLGPDGGGSDGADPKGNGDAEDSIASGAPTTGVQSTQSTPRGRTALVGSNGEGPTPPPSLSPSQLHGHRQADVALHGCPSIAEEVASALDAAQGAARVLEGECSRYMARYASERARHAKAVEQLAVLQRRLDEGIVRQANLSTRVQTLLRSLQVQRERTRLPDDTLLRAASQGLTEARRAESADAECRRLQSTQAQLEQRALAADADALAARQREQRLAHALRALVEAALPGSPEVSSPSPALRGALAAAEAALCCVPPEAAVRDGGHSLELKGLLTTEL